MGVKNIFAFLKEVATRLAIEVPLKLEETMELRGLGECASYQLGI